MPTIARLDLLTAEAFMHPGVVSCDASTQLPAVAA
jgi:hypothetical protein